MPSKRHSSRPTYNPSSGSPARRRFLARLGQGLFVALGGVPLASALARAASGPAEDSTITPTLDALVDALVPHDEQSPGALELGIPSRLREKLNTNRDHLALVTQGCQWLDRQARWRFGAKDFAQLPLDRRDRLIGLAAQAPPGSGPRAFFHRVRDDVFHYYYAEPRVWESIGYNGPPQPFGFMDHAQPPER